MTENKGDLISREALKEHKFVGNKFVQIGDRNNGKTLESINKAYQQGWNDCIDAIIDNAPSVTPDKIQAIMSDYLVYRCEPQRPQGEWGEPFSHGDRLYHKCSNCHVSTQIIFDNYFCPNCGADMRGEEE